MQILSDVAPVALEYVPATQLLHQVVPEPVEYVPWGHDWQTETPASENVPLSQVRQIPTVVACSPVA